MADVETPERARRARAWFAELAVEVLGVAGAAAVLYGTAQIYPPAAWILGGVAAVALAAWLAAIRAGLV